MTDPQSDVTSQHRHEPRIYRDLNPSPSRPAFTVRAKETDLKIYAPLHLKRISLDAVLTHRQCIEQFIGQYPGFARTLAPWRCTRPVPRIIAEMIRAGEAAGVGPMAAVAGTISEFVGRDLLRHTEAVIVENGGDIFAKTPEILTVGIYAGRSPLSMRIGIRIDTAGRSAGICTSSGTIGHSLSMGRADAACVLSPSCALSDAAATAIGNRVRSAADLDSAVRFGRQIDGVTGLVIVKGDKMAAWGKIELIPLSGKTG